MYPNMTLDGKILSERSGHVSRRWGKIPERPETWDAWFNRL
jgi:hypothetical protein